MFNLFFTNMNRNFAFISYALILIVFTRIDCRTITKKSRMLTITEKTSYENATLGQDTSTLHDYMILMNSTKFQQSQKETTIELLTDEAQYFDWGEQRPRFVVTPRGMLDNLSILHAHHFYGKRHKVYQKENVIESTTKGWEPSMMYIETLKSKATAFTPHNTVQDSYYDTKTDASLNQAEHFNVTLDKLNIPKAQNQIDYSNMKFETVSPPWVRYGPMQLKDEMGQNINLNYVLDRNSSEYRYQFPLARDRWWWEYERNYMHWYFWHCHHWMTNWLIDPPVSPKPLLTNNYIKDKQEDNQDDGSYSKEREYYFFIYCNWLLRGTVASNKSVDTNLKTQTTDNPSMFRGTPRKVMIPSLRQSKSHYRYEGYEVQFGNCYVCGRRHIEKTPVIRLCHRAFTDEKYFKFRHWLTAVCLNRPQYGERSDVRRSPLFANGSMEYYGRLYFNQCSYNYLEFGELYTERACRKVYFYKFVSPNHIQNVYDALEETIGPTVAEGCVSSPYSFFAPMSRSRPGLFSRAYFCVCTGEYCNLSNRQQYFISLPFFVLFLFSLFICR